MISYSVYKVLHLIGLFMVLLSLGGWIVLGAVGQGNDVRWKKLEAMTNGIGLVLLFITGFGLIARLKIPWPWPGWIISMVIIWIVFACLTAVSKRRPEAAAYLWWGSLVLAGVAAYLGNIKPF